MSRRPTRSNALANAQLNANASGVPWVIFTDTSGCWNSERYRPSASCHNDGGATIIQPEFSMIHLQTIPGSVACRSEESGGFTGHPSKVTCPNCNSAYSQLVYAGHHELDRPAEIALNDNDTRLLFKPRIDEHLLSLADEIDTKIDGIYSGNESCCITPKMKREFELLADNIRLIVADLLTKFPRPT